MIQTSLDTWTDLPRIVDTFLELGHDHPKLTVGTEKVVLSTYRTRTAMIEARQYICNDRIALFGSRAGVSIAIDAGTIKGRHFLDIMLLTTYTGLKPLLYTAVEQTGLTVEDYGNIVANAIRDLRQAKDQLCWDGDIVKDAFGILPEQTELRPPNTAPGIGKLHVPILDNEDAPAVEIDSSTKSGELWIENYDPNHVIAFTEAATLSALRVLGFQRPSCSCRARPRSRGTSPTRRSRRRSCGTTRGALRGCQRSSDGSAGTSCLRGRTRRIRRV
jgi:hypothetical protein